MLSTFCRGGNCYLCYTGREGRTLHLYLSLGDIECFHQQWQGSVSLYAVCLGWGSQERNCCVMAPYKLRSSSHQFPSFYLESRVSNAESSCRSCKGVAEKALLSVVLTIKLSMCPPRAADHLGWCSGGISPPKSNENPSLCPVLLYMNGISTW